MNTGKPRQTRCKIMGCDGVHRHIRRGLLSQALFPMASSRQPAHEISPAIPGQNGPGRHGNGDRKLMAGQQPRLTTCKIPGCGETPKIRRGWCPKHYMRWRRNGDPLVARVKYPSECTIAGCGPIAPCPGLVLSPLSPGAARWRLTDGGTTTEADALQNSGLRRGV